VQTIFHSYTTQNWDKRNSFLCLISWHWPHIWQQWSNIYQTL